MGPSEVCISGRGYRWLSLWLAVTLGCLVPEELPPQLKGWRRKVVEKVMGWAFFLWRSPPAQGCYFLKPRDQKEGKLFCFIL